MGQRNMDMAIDWSASQHRFEEAQKAIDLAFSEALDMFGSE